MKLLDSPQLQEHECHIDFVAQDDTGKSSAQLEQQGCQNIV